MSPIASTSAATQPHPTEEVPQLLTWPDLASLQSINLPELDMSTFTFSPSLALDSLPLYPSLTQPQEPLLFPPALPFPLPSALPIFPPFPALTFPSLPPPPLPLPLLPSSPPTPALSSAPTSANPSPSLLFAHPPTPSLASSSSSGSPSSATRPAHTPQMHRCPIPAVPDWLVLGEAEVWGERAQAGTRLSKRSRSGSSCNEQMQEVPVKQEDHSPSLPLDERQRKRPRTTTLSLSPMEQGLVTGLEPELAASALELGGPTDLDLDLGEIDWTRMDLQFPLVGEEALGTLGA